MDDENLPPRPTREQQVQRAKDMARKMLDELKSDDLEQLFDFADNEWRFDYHLKMTFFDEIHIALTERRNSVER